MLNKKIVLFFLLFSIAHSDPTIYQLAGDNGINLANSPNSYIDNSKNNYQVQGSELYLSLQSKNSTKYSSGVQRNTLKYAIERVVVQANYTDDFYENTHRKQESAYENVTKLGGEYSFNIFNNSNQDIKGISLRIFFPTEIRFLLIAPPLDNTFKYDTGYNPDTGFAELFLENDSLNLKANQVTQIPLAMVALSFPPIQKEYKIEYIIGSKHYQSTKKDVVFSAKIDNLPLMYVNNYKGLKHMYNGESDELDKAIKSFKNAIDNSPDNAAFNFNLCTAYIMNRQYKEALAPCLETYTKRGSKDYFVAGQLGPIYNKLKKFSKAIKYILQALSLKQNSIIDLQNLKFSLNNIQNKHKLVDSLSKKERELLLIFSSFLEEEELVIILLSKKVNVNIQTVMGTTALHNAAGIGNIRLVKQLVKFGAKTDIQDNSGYTAIKIAKEQAHQNIVKWLINISGT